MSWREKWCVSCTQDRYRKVLLTNPLYCVLRACDEPPTRQSKQSKAQDREGHQLAGEPSSPDLVHFRSQCSRNDILRIVEARNEQLEEELR